jgi:hypothetical protein
VAELELTLVVQQWVEGTKLHERLAAVGNFLGSDCNLVVLGYLEERSADDEAFGSYYSEQESCDFDGVDERQGLSKECSC